MATTGLVWFRNDLRVEDNTSLHTAMQAHTAVHAVYCFDPTQFAVGAFGFRKTEKYRAQFLIETVTALREALAKLHISLSVFYESPATALPRYIAEQGITAVYLQEEWTTEECQTLTAVQQATAHLPLSWNTTYDQFLYHPDEVPFATAEIPRVFTQFRKACEKKASVRPARTVAPATQQISEPIGSIPTLETLGYTPFEQPSHTAFPFAGGAAAAWQRVQQYFWDTQKLSYYKKTRNGLLGVDYSSKLSPWLANGSISPRSIYHAVRDYEQEIGSNQSTYWLIFELIWRDFFKYVSLQHGHRLFTLSGILQKSYDWATDGTAIQRWIDGQTDAPFVNANMIELQQTGWMSNRGRQNVASYFAKELQLDWRIGAAYFEAMLIDYDVHSNYGNWQYVSGVGNDPRDRKFNVALQAQRYDPKQQYQKRWLQTSLF